MLQEAVLVLLLTPEHGLPSLPKGRGLVQLRVRVTVWVPVPHDLEHEETVLLHADHPPCTAAERVLFGFKINNNKTINNSYKALFFNQS